MLYYMMHLTVFNMSMYDNNSKYKHDSEKVVQVINKNRVQWFTNLYYFMNNISIVWIGL